VDCMRLGIMLSIYYALERRRKSLGGPRICHIGDLLVAFRGYDALCLYVDRYQKKCHRNLRFGPLFSKGFLFFILDEDATFAYAHAALSLVSI
jgi:hypothetical protein